MILSLKFLGIPGWFINDDFIDYWSSGRLILEGKNPYDPNLLLDMQNQIGAEEIGFVMNWNPPPFLIISLPFSIFNYPLSRFLWFIFSISIIILCSSITWRLYHGSSNTQWLSLIVAFTFLPTLYCLLKGQASFLLLLGVVLFLYFVNQEKHFYAGASLILLVIKPHVVYLFGIAVVYWVIKNKFWSVFYGSIAALITSLMIIMIIEPSILGGYISMVRYAPPTNSATPTLGSGLRIILNNGSLWIQFIPTIFGILWLFFFIWRHRLSWSWLELTPIILLVSLVTAPYLWMWDQMVSIIAIIQIIVILFLLKKPFPAIIIGAIYFSIELLELNTGGDQFWRFWYAPVLLLFYIGSMTFLKKFIPSWKNK
jgi:hypothetical protein